MSLVQVGGRKHLSGGNALASGAYDELNKSDVLDRVKKGGFGHREQAKVEDAKAPEMDREVVSVVWPRDLGKADGQYATMFGPTTGDRVRLGDTNLWVEVEKDYTSYGDECKFGGGKSLAASGNFHLIHRQDDPRRHGPGFQQA